ncbi:10800_t:CDS:2, partial [Acaulospora colombiana]
SPVEAVGAARAWMRSNSSIYRSFDDTRWYRDRDSANDASGSENEVGDRYHFATVSILKERLTRQESSVPQRHSGNQLAVYKHG